MIKGIGVDIIEIERVEKAVNRSPRFIQRIFTEEEIHYFEMKNMKIESIAGNFAAKEAVMKTLGTGLRGFQWTDIEIVRNEFGKPEVRLYNEALRIAESQDIKQIMISISHCKTYAVANGVAV